MDPYHPRIVGVGFNKTGTTSLKRSFTALELGPIVRGRSGAVHRAKETLFARNDYEKALRVARKYRCFEDRPWNVWEMYRHFDECYPNSLFILTIRDSENWWRSVKRWLTLVKPRMVPRYCDHLRVKELEKGAMIAAYEAYNRAVRAYFASSGRLLVLDFEAGAGWSELCEFLDLPVPDLEFPHVNRLSYDERDEEKAKQRDERRLKRMRKRRENQDLSWSEQQEHKKEQRWDAWHQRQLEKLEKKSERWLEREEKKLERKQPARSPKQEQRRLARRGERWNRWHQRQLEKLEKKSERWLEQQAAELAERERARARRREEQEQQRIARRQVAAHTEGEGSAPEPDNG